MVYTDGVMCSWSHAPACSDACRRAARFDAESKLRVFDSVAIRQASSGTVGPIVEPTLVRA